jgi:hypothetical protein
MADDEQQEEQLQERDARARQRELGLPSCEDARRLEDLRRRRRGLSRDERERTVGGGGGGGDGEGLASGGV